MTYVLLTDAGEVDVRPETPTVDTVIEMTGDGTPELVRLPGGDKIVAWVDDNWISRVKAGEFQRNRIASVVHLIVAGDLTPLGGPVVFTALKTEDGQLLPADLDEDVTDALTVVATDVAAVLLGHPQSASFYTNREDPRPPEEAAQLEHEILEASRRAERLPLAPLDGGWTVEKQLARDRERGLRAVAHMRESGMPEDLIRLLCDISDFPYPDPEQDETTEGEDPRKDV